jgi:hypothetical protein
MKAKLNITMQDGTMHELTAIVPDFIAWERYSKKKISDLVTNIALEDMAYIGYTVLKRQGEKVKPFDGWLAEVEDIEMGDEDPKATK